MFIRVATTHIFMIDLWVSLCGENMQKRSPILNELFSFCFGKERNQLWQIYYAPCFSKPFTFDLSELPLTLKTYKFKRNSIFIFPT